MSEPLEQALREALRAPDPGEVFTRRVLGRLPATRAAGLRRYAWPVGIAASVLLAVGVQQQITTQRARAEGLRAKQELLEALRVTSGKLDLAYEAVAKENES